ncbi:MAG TPA: hypothetical protein VFS21_14660 [Roseiflexaceae bacterium]|nr:hypothetical protein [Roseiflexaceae bacterium]
MSRDHRPKAACLYLCVALVLLFGTGLRPGMAEAQVPVAAQQVTPGPTATADAEVAPTRRRDMSGPVLALTCLVVLNAIGLAVMLGLSSRMRAVAEEALQNKRRKG